MCNSLFLVGNAEQEVCPMETHEVDLVWPLNSDILPRHEGLIRQLGSSIGSKAYLTSDVSCIKLLRKSFLPTDITSKHFLYPSVIFAVIIIYVCHFLRESSTLCIYACISTKRK